MDNRILVLLKKASEYGIPTQLPKAGLFNSSRFLVEGLRRIGVEYVESELCVDANEIDKFITIHKPKICIIEAIWVTPDKFKELVKLHPNVKFIVRVHSKIPFLAMEGIALRWLIEYTHINNVYSSFNNLDTSNDLFSIIPNLYLPNFYQDIKQKITFWDKLKYIISYAFGRIELKTEGIVKIGCFGAIRPLKNQLNQAIAAIKFADKHKVKLQFYINGSRAEQGGENVLKNIRALFAATQHELIEISWKSHKEFLSVVNKMDICMQVSYTESFNIVTADAISQEIPIVVSKDINWVNIGSKADYNNVDNIVSKLEDSLFEKTYLVKSNRKHLELYNKNSTKVWKKVLNIS